jgi:hypothetical protein
MMPASEENHMQIVHARVARRVALAALVAVAGCSGGGYLSTPGSGVGTPTPAPATTATPTPPNAALLTLGQSGAMPTQGLPGTFVLSLAEYAANKTLVKGAYGAPITVTTNDSADLTFTVTDPSGASVGNGSSATIADSTASVVVTYSGNAVPAGTQISASASGVATTTLPFSPVTGSGTSANVASLTISEIGAVPVQGSAGQFALAVTALDPSGAPISGTYATPIVVTTNDVTDIGLSTVLGAAPSASVTLPNSQTPVFVTYSGNRPPNGAEFSATAGSLSASVPFATTSATQLTTISKLYLTRVGANPLSNSPGASAVYVYAYDQSGTLLGGTLPSAVTVTINSDCDLGLSIGGPIVVTDYCGMLLTLNPTAVTINNSNQVVYVNYAAGLNTNAGAQLSASTVDDVCSAITFPGNAETACPPVAPPAPASPTSILRRTTATRH